MIRRNGLGATEFQEQCALYDWCKSLEGMVPALQMFMAHPNGGVRPARFDAKGKRFSPEGQRMQSMGVKAGFPDISIHVPVRDAAGRLFHALFIELKIEAGRASEKQQAWCNALRARGYRAEIVVGWVRAARLIVQYLDPTLTERERRVLSAAIPMS